MVDSLLMGLATALQWHNLAWCLLGVSLGTMVGVLPGIGVITGLSLLLPLTYHIDATAAVIMLAGVYYGASYGCSITSILLNIPGTPASSVTCIDGYPMSQKGRAGQALLLTALGSFVGGMIGIAILILSSHGLADIAYAFGSAEYFSVMLLGLTAACVMTSVSVERNLAMVCLGILLGLMGTDATTGTTRLDFGVPGLIDGINVAVLAMGLFGVAEVFDRLTQDFPKQMQHHLLNMRPTLDEWIRSAKACLRGTGIGSAFGILPGTGPSVASFVSYAVEKQVSSDPQRFGHGAVEGVVGPESANNAAAQTEFIPTLGLGIPGEPAMALILAALIIQGIVPGPMLMSNQPELFWGLVVSFVIGNIMLLVINIPLIKLWTTVLKIPYSVIYPTILVLIALGAYTINFSTFDVSLVLLFGIAGLIMRRWRYEAAPLLLGFVLGPVMEEQLRKSLVISQGDFGIFVNRPMSLAFLFAAVVLLIWAAWRNRPAPGSQNK